MCYDEIGLCAQNMINYCEFDSEDSPKHYSAHVLGIVVRPKNIARLMQALFPRDPRGFKFSVDVLGSSSLRSRLAVV